MLDTAKKIVVVTVWEEADKADLSAVALKRLILIEFGHDLALRRSQFHGLVEFLAG
jgi:hypothetical protein